MAEPLLEARGLVRRFPGVLALDGVDLDIRAGEVLAVIGENGAGKSTLMKILAGVQEPDEGEIRIAGERVRIPNVRAAERLGISARRVGLEQERREVGGVGPPAPR